MENWTNIVRLWMTFVYFCYIYIYLLWMTFGAFCYNNDRYDRDSRSTHAPKNLKNNHRYFLADFTWPHPSSILPRQTLIGWGDDRCLEKGEGRQHHHLDPGLRMAPPWKFYAEIYTYIERNTNIQSYAHVCMWPYAKMYAHTHMYIYYHILIHIYIFIYLYIYIYTV